MSNKDIAYYPTKSKKGVWVVIGGIEFEFTDILAIFEDRPSKKKVKTFAQCTETLEYDYIRVEQIEVEK
jgi:hypothetical protein